VGRRADTLFAARPEYVATGWAFSILLVAIFDGCEKFIGTYG